MSEKYENASADLATGFRKVGGQWERSGFSVEAEKYVIRPRQDDDSDFVRGATMIVKVGEHTPTAWCAEPLRKDVWLNCEGYGEAVWKISTHSLRFTYWAASGYVGGEQDNDTPYIAIGKCAWL
jgi:hypothetical protein